MSPLCRQPDPPVVPSDPPSLFELRQVALRHPFVAHSLIQTKPEHNSLHPLRGWGDDFALERDRISIFDRSAVSLGVLEIGVAREVESLE